MTFDKGASTVVSQRAYEAPKLRSYGSLSEVTTGSSIIANPENHPTQTQKAKP